MPAAKPSSSSVQALQESVRRVLPRPLSVFDLDSINLSQHIIFMIGKRGSGKSELIRYLVYKKRHTIDMLIAVSKSEAANRFYEQMMVPTKYICYEFDKKYLNAIFNRIERAKTRPRTLVILDDVAFQGAGFWQSDFVSKMLFMGRHFNIGVIFAVQYVMMVPISMRANYNFAFVMQENSVQVIKRIYDSFFSFVDSLDTFRDIFQYYTQNYSSLISIGSTSNPDITRCMARIRAVCGIGPFLIGCAEYRAYYTIRQIQMYVDYHQARRPAKDQDADTTTHPDAPVII